MDYINVSSQNEKYKSEPYRTEEHIVNKVESNCCTNADTKEFLAQGLIKCSDGSVVTVTAVVDQKVADDDMDLLARMEEQNKIIEQDSKSISGNGSRKSVDSDSGGSNCDAHVQSQLSDDLQEDLWAVWGSLVKNFEVEFKKRPQYIKDLVRKGIPCHFRTIAWQLLSNANPEAVHDLYAEYMRSSSPHEKVIKRDVSRTYPDHDFYKDPDGRGQQSLLNVMKAYSLHDREVGYCQGSAFIAGLLLLQMPEEEAYSVLLALMEDYRMRELYRPAMTELGLCMFQLECLVQEQMPDLYMHFQNMGFDTSMYASSWFLTLFTTQLPLDLANRVMDVFISEGMEMVFRIALAILQISRVDLLQLDMEGMLRFFQKDLSLRLEHDSELLFSRAYDVKYNQKKIKKLEKDYMTKRTKEQEEAVELRRLRTENRLLRQRIEYLEQESAALADRLIQGQVNLAEEAETCISIKHQLYKLREMNADAHRKLEGAYETIRDLTHDKAKEGEAPTAAVQVDDQEMIERIHGLQQELMETKSREADNEGTIRELRNRVQDLECANKRLKETPPDHGVASLQEELISVKMREAEASLALKEMRQKIQDLEQQWEKYTSQRCNGAAVPCGSSGDSQGGNERRSTANSILSQASGLVNSLRESSSNAANIRELEDQLMGVRIREAETLAELKEMRHKIMEKETQIRRQDDEYKKLYSDFEKMQKVERKLQSQLKDMERKCNEAESQLKEQKVMAKLKETELNQTVGELRHKIAELNSKKAEKQTRDEINRSGDCSYLDEDTAHTPVSLTSSMCSEEFSAELVSSDLIMSTPSGCTENGDLDNSLTPRLVPLARGTSSPGEKSEQLSKSDGNRTRCLSSSRPVVSESGYETGTT